MESEQSQSTAANLQTTPNLARPLNTSLSKHDIRSTTFSFRPVNEHLGTSWEIAIVIVMVALLVAILAATIFQIRRRRRQKQRQALETDTENGKALRGRIHAQDERRQTSSVNTFDQVDEKHSHPVIVRDEIRTEEIQKPSPSLQSKQAHDSSYNEYLSKKPPNYYWEQRFH